jgi:hypothetical protein
LSGVPEEGYDSVMEKTLFVDGHFEQADAGKSSFLKISDT